MATIQIFERTGASVSPPVEADGDFVRETFTNGLRWLQTKGVIVERHDLREDKSALEANPTVKSAFEAQGPDCLPMVVVDDTIISVGGYPTRAELTEAAGIPAGNDPQFLGELTMEAAALGAALEANAFDRFEQHCERLRLLGIRNDDLIRAVQSVTASATGGVRDEMRTRVDQFLAFGPQGKPPKPSCTCANNG
jgi:hypothetical protein